MTDEEASNNIQVKKGNTLTKTYYGETSVNIEETVLIWTIKNAAKCYVPVGGSCGSAEYVIDVNGKSAHWEIMYFPNGCNESLELWTSLQLDERTYTGIDQKFYVKIGVIDALGVERVQYQNFITISADIQTVLTVEKFIRKNDMADFIVNGNLKIICRLYTGVKLKDSPITQNLCKSMETNEASNDLADGFSDFEKLLDGSKFSDVKLVSNGQEFPAHKTILSARSRVFEAMFEHAMKENATNVVTITDIDGEVVQEMLRFIYAGKVSGLETMADKLLIAADKYELNGLKTMCENAMIASLSNKTIEDILILVDRNNAEKLRDSAIEFITMHANELSSDDNFNATIKILSPSLLALVIKALMSRA